MVHLALLDIEGKLLVLGLLGLNLLWYVVPADAWLFHADLVPWVAVSLGVVLGLRADRLGPRGHPQLSALTTTRGALALRVASACVPLLLMALDALAMSVEDADASGWTDLVTAVVPALPVGLALAAITGAGAWIGRNEGRTAWRPAAKAGVGWVAGVGLLWALALAGQVLLGANGEPDVPSSARTAWLSGASFLLAASLWDRHQSASQAAVLQARWSGRPSARQHLARVLAAAVPAVGVAFFCGLARGIGWGGTAVPSALDESGVEQLATVALPIYLTSAAIAVWPRRPVVGVMAVLHEVVPVGGAEPGQPGAAADTSPPRGTLRFHPDRVRRTGLAVPWPVPLRRALAEPPLLGRESLWSEDSAPPLRHVLGDAYLDEPGWLQLRRVRIDAAGGDDVVPLGRGDNQERRLVIYSRRSQGDATRRTWRWERAAPGVLHVDPSTRGFVLRDGDVILIASGMVAQLYEIELGDAIREGDLAFTDALPRFQDEVGA